MRKLLLSLFILALLIIPASATITVTAEPQLTGVTKYIQPGPVSSFSYDGEPDGKGIVRANIDCPIDTTVAFTVTYGTGNTKSGTYHYYRNGSSFLTLGHVTSHIVFDGKESLYTYGSSSTVGRVFVTGYGKDVENGIVLSRGFLVWAGTLSVNNFVNDYVYVPVTGDIVMSGLSLNADNPVKISVMTNDRTAISDAVSKSFLDVVNEWVEYATSIGGTILQVASDTLYWLKFIFVDNLTLVISLYIAASMAFAARSCNGNPIKMGRIFVRDQTNLFHFILNLWNTFISLISSFRGIFRI